MAYTFRMCADNRGHKKSQNQKKKATIWRTHKKKSHRQSSAG